MLGRSIWIYNRPRYGTAQDISCDFFIAYPIHPPLRRLGIHVRVLLARIITSNLHPFVGTVDDGYPCIGSFRVGT